MNTHVISLCCHSRNQFGVVSFWRLEGTLHTTPNQGAAVREVGLPVSAPCERACFAFKLGQKGGWLQVIFVYTDVYLHV